jgi:hypothetical protein
VDLDIREIAYMWKDDPEELIYFADVVVGKGEPYDEYFDEYDPRIFFYFVDEEEFQNANSIEDSPFIVMAVERV